jgi:hypothetical protein
MTTFKQRIKVDTGILGTNYKMADDAIFFITGTTTFTVIGSGNVNSLYYVVGGGGGGSKGIGGYDGRGGGGGGVETGMIDLIGDKTYTITVGAGGTGQTNDSRATNGQDSSIVSTSVSIVAKGGYDGTRGINADPGSRSGTGVSGAQTDVSTASPPMNNTNAYGNGGISAKIGGTAGVKGNETNTSGTNSPSIGGGGGGGYNMMGNGGNGGKGAVILILTDNSNKIKYIEKQLREMNHLPGTMVDQYNQQYNTTMMAGALWTVLATSLVYYVFTRV